MLQAFSTKIRRSHLACWSTCCCHCPSWQCSGVAATEHLLVDLACCGTFLLAFVVMTLCLFEYTTEINKLANRPEQNYASKHILQETVTCFKLLQKSTKQPNKKKTKQTSHQTIWPTNNLTAIKSIPWCFGVVELWCCGLRRLGLFLAAVANVGVVVVFVDTDWCLLLGNSKQQAHCISFTRSLAAACGCPGQLHAWRSVTWRKRFQDVCRRASPNNTKGP